MGAQFEKPGTLAKPNHTRKQIVADLRAAIRAGVVGGEVATYAQNVASAIELGWVGGETRNEIVGRLWEHFRHLPEGQREHAEAVREMIMGGELTR